MGRNKTQRHADYLIKEAITYSTQKVPHPKPEDYEEDQPDVDMAKKILEEARDREPNHAKGADVNSIESIATEKAKDLPPSIDHKKLLEISVERLEQRLNPHREGGYEGELPNGR